ncbi:MAG: hypothetical protein RIQ36_1441 [Pseudomonadota bacterium]|jgi:hypothetical protein
MKSNSTLFILLNLQVSNKIEKELSQKVPTDGTKHSNL